MAFQFHCPRGHLLEADPSQVGQQCQCPLCGELFAIGAPAEEAAVSIAPRGAATTSANPFDEPAPTRMLHIPCPRGHELEVPPEMIGQEVLCPHCQTQFRLRIRDSIEHKRKRQQELDLKDYKRGQLWMTWAVIFAVVVLLGLAILIGISATSS